MVFFAVEIQESKSLQHANQPVQLIVVPSHALSSNVSCFGRDYEIVDQEMLSSILSGDAMASFHDFFQDPD
tara:strand:+ start:57 stop:269 length:213 start_codon:yes stop_codon:yes gene_type:complete